MERGGWKVEGERWKVLEGESWRCLENRWMNRVGRR
jgi:hypothetical protein